jgi:hypothetical protein
MVLLLRVWSDSQHRGEALCGRGADRSRPFSGTARKFGKVRENADGAKRVLVWMSAQRGDHDMSAGPKAARHYRLVKYLRAGKARPTLDGRFSGSSRIAAEPPWRGVCALYDCALRNGCRFCHTTSRNHSIGQIVKTREIRGHRRA